MKIHHIGYLVKNIEKAKEKFFNLGFEIKQDIVCDKDRGIGICFMENNGYVIELVSPNKENSVVSNLIKTYKNSPYHICYSSESFEEDLQNLVEHGYTQMGEVHPACAINGKAVVFLMNSQIGMIELLNNND